MSNLAQVQWSYYFMSIKFCGHKVAFGVSIKFLWEQHNIGWISNLWIFADFFAQCSALNRVTRTVTLCFTPHPLFQWYLQSNEILLNLGVKCWNSAFNVHRSRVIIVVVQGGAVKIYVAAVRSAKGNTRWNPISHQIGWKN